MAEAIDRDPIAPYPIAYGTTCLHYPNTGWQAEAA
jgi:hypothetical protein